MNPGDTSTCTATATDSDGTIASSGYSIVGNGALTTSGNTGYVVINDSNTSVSLKFSATDNEGNTTTENRTIATGDITPP